MGDHGMTAAEYLHASLLSSAIWGVVMLAFTVGGGMALAWWKRRRIVHSGKIEGAHTIVQCGTCQQHHCQECGRPVGVVLREVATDQRCTHEGIGLPGCIVCDPRTKSQGGPRPDHSGDGF